MDERRTRRPEVSDYLSAVSAGICRGSSSSVEMSVFSDIYRKNLWNGIESLSGPGSGTAATRDVAQAITQIVAELDIRSVLDYGCGDGFWMPDLPGYVGFDPTPEAVERARFLHPDREYHSDPGYGVTGTYDLVIVRDVIQHLDLASACALLHRLRSGDYGIRVRFMLASHYVGTVNRDIRPGDAYSPNLTAPPFNMPEPEYLIPDGAYYHEHETGQVRDPQKFLALWRLRP